MGLVQHASNTADSTTCTVTLGSDPTAGNCLIVCISAGGASPTISSVKIGGSADNFAQAAGTTGDEDSASYIWTDQGLTVTDSTSVVVTASTTGGLMVDVYEWNGVISSGAVDKTATEKVDDSTSWSVSTGTLSQAEEVIFGANGGIFAGTVTITGPGSPWTNESQLNITVDSQPCAAQSSYQQVDATTSITYSGSYSQDGFTAAVVVSLKISTSITVNLPVLELTINAFQLTQPPITVSLPLITTTIDTFTLTPNVPPAITVALPLLTLSINAQPLTPDVLPVPPKLIVSIASQAGTDSYGNSFPQGLFASEGVIEGPTIVGSTLLLYNGTPAAGSLIVSVQEEQGSDIYGNLYLPGLVNYYQVSDSLYYAVQIYEGSITYWQGTGYNSFSSLFSFEQEGTGLVINANTVTFSGDGISIGNGSSANLNLDPLMATPTNYAEITAGTATAAEICAFLASWYSEFINRGMANS